MGSKANKIIRYIFSSFLDVIYPYENKCSVCGAENFIGLCSCCKSKIKRSLDNEDKEILTYGFYGGPLKQLVLNFKYHKDFTAGKVLSEFLIELINDNKINSDYICYVPMNKKDIKKRGYNQCEIIAKNISEIVNIPVIKGIKKVKATKTQKTLDRRERLLNVKGAFEANEKLVKNKTILLIDDVITTGDTVLECKKKLKKAGANQIIVLTIAKSQI